MRITIRPGRAGLRLCGAMAVAGLFAVGPAQGQTLQEALAQAYLGNPTLNNARATLRATDENVPQARAASRPTIQATGSAGLAETKSGNTDTPLTNANKSTYHSSTEYSGFSNTWYQSSPRTAGVQITQPIYRGGGIDAGIDRAEAAVLAQRASLLDTEQTVLLQTATAYLDVVQAQALVELQINFETVQKRDLQAFQGRFTAGEVTRTDVALQEAQVASAAAARVSAEGALAAARATFAKLVGAQPGPKLALPKLSYPMPASLDEAIAQAIGRSPKVVYAAQSESAARADIDVADSSFMPRVDLTASGAHNLDSTRRNDFRTAGSIIASVTIPLDTGASAAKSRQARQSANAARINIEQTKRAAQESAITAWQGLATARASISSYQAAVKANEMAAEGMHQQLAVGSSTIIDLLNTEQALLNARVNLAKAQHDENVSKFNLLFSIGELTAQTLALPVQYYDYEAHYRNVRGRWFGSGIDE